MNLPTSFSDLFELGSDPGLSDDGRKSLEFLNMHGYAIKIGANVSIQQQISTLSSEPAIREYCPNDTQQRFGTIDKFEKWLSKGRVLVTVWQDEKIVGYGWAGNGTSSRVASGENTFAIRLGSAASGKGLATHFARLIVEASNILFGLKDIWLETWQSNGGAVHIYHKIGFIDVAEEKSSRKKADGSEVDDVRLYMSLPNENLPTK